MPLLSRLFDIMGTANKHYIKTRLSDRFTSLIEISKFNAENSDILQFNERVE